MTDKSVQVLPLARNDIASLAHLYEAALSHFKQHSSSSEPNYLKFLNIIVNLYILTLIESQKIIISDPIFQTFHTQYPVMYHQPAAMREASFAIARMVSFTAHTLPLLNYPWYAKDFAHAIKETLGSPIACLYGGQTEAQRLLNMLLPTDTVRNLSR